MLGTKEKTQISKNSHHPLKIASEGIFLMSPKKWILTGYAENEEKWELIKFFGDIHRCFNKVNYYYPQNPKDRQPLAKTVLFKRGIEGKKDQRKVAFLWPSYENGQNLKQ